MINQKFCIKINNATVVPLKSGLRKYLFPVSELLSHIFQNEHADYTTPVGVKWHKKWRGPL